MITQYSTLASPLGELMILVRCAEKVGASDVVLGIFYPHSVKRPSDAGQYFSADQLNDNNVSPLLKKAAEQLKQYFLGERQQFDLPLDPQGTDFQKQVWQVLQTIPFGETWCYQDIANAIGNPKAVRAVGAANGKNPCSIVIPCHRVIGKDGSLTGYAGGLDRKQMLLKLERQHSTAG